jgi:hypothetical protein
VNRALLLCSVLATTAAVAHAPYGPPELNHVRSERIVRLGPSAAADATSEQRELCSGFSRPLEAVWLYVDAVYTAGDVTVSIVDPAQPAVPLGSGTITIAVPGWYEWAFSTPIPPPPASLPFPYCLSFTVSPQGPAELSFHHMIHSFEADPQKGGDYPAEIWLAGPPGPQTGLDDFTAVFRLTGSDPYALDGCTDRGAVAGFPYVTLTYEPPPDGGVLTQRLVMPDEHFMAYPGQVEAGFTGDWTIPATITLQRPDGGGAASVVEPNGNFSGGPNPVDPPPDVFFQWTDAGAPEGFDVVVFVDGGGASLGRFDSLSANLGPCHPVSRATFGGNRAFAVGEPLGVDFAVDVVQLAAGLAFADRDNDGYGDPEAPAYVTSAGLPGYVMNAGDCDDSRATVHPNALELCNGRDDNCDGLIDAADPLLSTSEPCALTSGVCAGAAHAAAECVNGSWKACPATRYGPHYSTAELACDGLDNDCDGLVDNGLEGPLCANQTGVCAGAHSRHCGTGAWAGCTADDYDFPYEPVETRCDRLDNDCDGQVDEGCQVVLPVADPDLPAAPPPCGCTSSGLTAMLLAVFVFRRAGRR